MDRSSIPQPGQAPEIKIAKPAAFVLRNGLRVFVVEDHKIPKVSYLMIFDSDPVLEGKNAGYVSIAGQLIGTETKNRKKDQIDEEIDYIGAKLSYSGESVYASCLKKHNEKLLELMADGVQNSVFTEGELKKTKKRNITALSVNENDPNYIASRLLDVLIYGKSHPYGEIASENSLSSVSVELCRKYYEQFYRPNNAYLSIVGDITIDEARELVESYFGKWQSAVVPAFKYKTPIPPQKNVIVIVDKPDAVQSVIKIGYPINYYIGCPSYLELAAANTILGGGTYRLFDNLREKHGYTYGAYSKVTPNENVGYFMAYASVRSAVSDSAVIQFLYEMNRMSSETVSEKELTAVKTNIGGNFALSLEDPNNVARFAYNIVKFNLPLDYYTNYLKSIDAITADDIKNVSSKYILPSNSYILLVGKASEIASKMKTLSPDGKVLFYDINGNKINSKK